MKKITEHTYGSHIYMKIRLDNGEVGEVTCYIRESGMTYKTSADGYDDRERENLIQAFKELY